MKKSIYVIKELYDVDGGFGDAIPKERVVGYVEATKEQIDEFVAKWHHPRCYDVPYSALWEHAIKVEEFRLSDIETLVPYEGDPLEPHCSSYSEEADGSSPYDDD